MGPETVVGTPGDTHLTAERVSADRFTRLSLPGLRKSMTTPGATSKIRNTRNGGAISTAGEKYCSI